MRKFCLLICISLFSSMFHAVAMPVETLQAPAIETVVAQEHHACREDPSASTAKSCKLSGHLCCLGITAATHTKLLAAAYGTELFNPVLHILVLQDHPNKQFKPPRPSLQS
jgi:hypothetical protein